MCKPVVIRGWRQVCGLLGLTLLLWSCEDAATTPPPTADVPPSTDVQGADSGSDTAGASDVAADTLAGGDAGSDTTQPCPQACIDSDDNPCSYAVCEEGECKVKLLDDASSCEDGDPCTTGETCKAGTCSPSQASGSNVCGCEVNADCESLDDGLACNGTLYCDKTAFPYACKVNPATVPPCESQTPPSSCLIATCLEPAVSGGKAQCSWKKAADASPCNDGNDLTEGDICLQGTCQPGLFVGSCQTNSDCAQFEDGNLCNGQLFCNKAKAKCQLNPATLVVCPTAGDTGCLRNTCVPASGQCLLQPQPDGLPCDDANLCTTSDTCQAGTCTGAGNGCSCASDVDCGAFEDGDLCNGTLFCNLQTATCQLNPATIVQCGQATEPCQTSVCLPATGTCTVVAAADGEPCNADNNLCTPSDSCSAGTCQATANVCKCSKDADCAAFDDQDQCNGQLYCNLQNGSCEPNPASVVVCDPLLNTTCSVQQCQPLSGDCTAVAIGDGLGCDDGDSCTLGETCSAGSCVGGSKFCACSSDLDCAGQEDGNYCNGLLYCDKLSNTCQVNPDSIVLCNDPTPTDCFASVCAPATGLCQPVTKTNGVVCDDGDACTLADSCTDTGVCTGAGAGCGCASDLDCAGLDDDDVCNGQVYCDLTVFPLPQCAVGSPIACSEVTCAVVTCNPQTGACDSQVLPDAATCSDGDPCTELDACAAGQCAGSAKNCDDANACTADLCAAGTCQHLALADNLPCDDGSACTPIDYCQQGQCSHTEVSCVDENDCTEDLCDPLTGDCAWEAIDGGDCYDYDECTLNDTCQAGTCVGTPVVCGGLGPNCLVDMCVDGTCQEVEAANWSICDDGNPCSQTSYCNRGSCEGTENVTCDDGLPCTTDPACDPLVASGCGPGLDDGNPSVYWSNTAPPAELAFSGLAYESGRWATVAPNGPGTDPVLRIWDGPGASPTDTILALPGSNHPSVVAGDRSGGWLVAGYRGPNEPSSAFPTGDAQPLLMRTSAAGVLKWATTSLVANASISTIATDPADYPGHVVVAGVRNAHQFQTNGLMWLAEVDVSGDQGPVLVRSGHCSGGQTMVGKQGMFANTVTRLSGGDWLVGGYALANYDGSEVITPAWCRFDSELKPVGVATIAKESANTTGWQIREVFATPTGGFWTVTTSLGSARWQTYDAAGQLLSDLPIASGAKEAIPAGNGLLVLMSEEDNSFLSVVPAGGALQENVISKDLGGIPSFGLLRDPSGIAWLQRIGLELTLVHTDHVLADTCEKAAGCPNGCDDGNSCTANLCVEGQCQNPQVACDDGNACTLDQCNNSGCVSEVMDGMGCDDGSPCTVADTCMGATCQGSDRFGTTSNVTAASEQIIDGVVHGDGLLVLGQRQDNGQQLVFWRKYNSAGQVEAQADLTPGTALHLARYAWADGGAFPAQDTPAALVKDDLGVVQLWYLAVGGQQQEGPLNLPAHQSLARQPLVQRGGNEVAVMWRYDDGTSSIFTYVPDDIWTELTSFGSTTQQPLALVSIEDYWVVVLDAPESTGGVLVLIRYDGAGVELDWTSEDYSFSGEPQEPDSRCHGVHVHNNNVVVSCGDNNAIWYTPLGTSAFGTGTTLQLVDYSRDSADVSHRTTGGGQGGLALAGKGTDGEWTLHVHDGLFNIARSLPIVAGSVPVVAGSASDIWVVTETVVGTTVQVNVHHWDAYGNSSCEGSGACFAEPCTSAGSCQLDTCTTGSCGTKWLDININCIDGQECQFSCGGA